MDTNIAQTLAEEWVISADAEKPGDEVFEALDYADTLTPASALALVCHITSTTEGDDRAKAKAGAEAISDRVFLESYIADETRWQGFHAATSFPGIDRAAAAGFLDGVTVPEFSSDPYARSVAANITFCELFHLAKVAVFDGAGNVPSELSTEEEAVMDQVLCLLHMTSALDNVELSGGM